MYDDDGDTFGMLVVLLLILVIVIAILIGATINHSKDIELEKYKIQMNVYGESTNKIEE